MLRAALVDMTTQWSLGGCGIVTLRLLALMASMIFLYTYLYGEPFDLRKNNSSQPSFGSILSLTSVL